MLPIFRNVTLFIKMRNILINTLQKKYLNINTVRQKTESKDDKVQRYL